MKTSKYRVSIWPEVPCENSVDYEADTEDMFPFEDEHFKFLDVLVTENDGSVEFPASISVDEILLEQKMDKFCR